ncbi:MAG: Xaa-Pro peptidase family protein [Candidatus Bathyarchaeia archaeon]
MRKLSLLRKKAFEVKDLDGLLILNEANMFYVSGFNGAAALLITRDSGDFLYVYGVNYEQAKAESKDFQIELIERGERPLSKIAQKVKSLGIKNLAFDMLGLEGYREIVKVLKDGVKLRMCNKLLWELRKVKDEEELMLMRKAAELTMEGMKAAYANVKPGVKEYEVAAEIEYAMRRHGSWGTAFDTIVASGPRSAYPHGGCTEREIRDGDLVVVDIGASYKYYRSDMTRTLVAGAPTKKQQELYELVKRAQENALLHVKPGVEAKLVDMMARKIIVEAGYGDFFVHGLGHGIGIEVHEPPTLSPQSKDILCQGNVVTIEPGIYIVGFGGVRIEDTILVNLGSYEKFTDGFYSLEPQKF